MTIRQKILMLGLISILGMAYTLWLQYRAYNAQISAIDAIGRNDQAVRALSQVIHELQKERGLMTIAQTGAGAQDTAAQIRNTDAALARFSAAGVDVKAFQQTLIELRSRTREKSDLLVLRDSYIQLIRDFIDYFGYLISKPGPESISRSISAQMNLVLAKEYLGQIRATMGYWIEHGRDDRFIHQNLVQLRKFYESAIRKFRMEASSDLQGVFDEQFSGQEIERLQRIIAQAVDTTRLPDGLNAAAWWNMATLGVDRLQAVENSSLHFIQQKAEAELQQIRNTMQAGTIVTIGFCLLILVLVISTVLAILRSVSSVHSSIGKIVSSGNFQARIPVRSKDEIGKISQGFNELLDMLDRFIHAQEERIEERTRELSVSNEQLREEISERKQAEENIKAQARLLDLVFKHSLDSIVLLDKNYNFIRVSETYARACQRDASELLGRNHFELYPSKLQDEFEETVRKKIIYTRSERPFIFPDHPEWGATYWDLGCVPILDNKGEIEFFLFTLKDVTDRRQAEIKLKESEKRFRHLFESSPDPIWIIEGHQFVDCNQAAVDMLGYPDKASLKNTHPSALSPERQPDGESSYSKAEKMMNIAQNKGLHRFEWVHTRKDGTNFFAEVTLSPITLQGRPAIHCLWRDITENKKAQIELQHKQGLLNEAQRLGQLGSWELDLVSGKLYWSEEIYRIFELDPAQFSPSYENFLNRIHPEDRGKVNEAYTRSLKDRQSYDIVHRLQMVDGRIKWVREHCSTSFDASGKPQRSVGALQDITAYKLAEDRLRVAAVAFDTDEAILIADAQANIISVNKAFTRITGYEPQEVLGKNPRILSSGRMDMAFYAEMWKELLDTGTWSGEIWDRRKSGEIYPKWLTISAVKNGEDDITEFVAMFSDITERKKAEEEIRTLAFYDALTGLPNRRLLMERFQLALSVSDRNLHYGAVLFLDMDKFKTLNDTLGHDHGDLMLLDVAKRIHSCVREADTVARLGGDEFVVLLEGISISEEEASQKAAVIAEKIRQALSEPYQLKGHEYHSSPSMGVCLFRGYKESIDSLLKHADVAMYQAKEAGRNTVRFFDPAMQQVVQLHAALDRDLRHAIAGNQLLLHYQIQVDSDIKPIGAEALVRWVHPERGMVSPAQFIPVAEDSRLILEIGQWVLDTACSQLASWSRHELTRNLELAINVSARQFGQVDFVQQVETAVRRHGIAPECLKLELTESVVLKDVVEVVKKMHALKAMGIKLSLDDFGTGYSSLSYLKKLPLDQIKIDQGFVRDATSDPNDAMMVKTIIDLAQNFHLNVIAEGVETAVQLTFLRESGCMAYQGYLFGMPMPAAEFEEVVRSLREEGQG